MSDAADHPTDRQVAGEAPDAESTDAESPSELTAGEREVERQREVDPDAPGLGAFDEGGEDAPEPNEPA